MPMFYTKEKGPESPADKFGPPALPLGKVGEVCEA
jgi:hypothetical protein